jgi:hypothetical protein
VTSLAVAAFLLTSIGNVTAPVFAAVGMYATFGLLVRTRSSDDRNSVTVSIGLLLIVVVSGTVAGFPGLPFHDPLATALTVISASLAVALSFSWMRGGQARWLYVALGVLVACLGVVGTRLIVEAQGREGIADAYAFHESATDHLLAGNNPYQSAQVLSSDPYVPAGTTIVGYSYPPITMTPLVLSSTVFGDSRWVLLICWLGTIAVLGVRAIEIGGHLLPPVLLLGLFPAFRVTLFSGWTELLTLGAASLLVLGRTESGGLFAWRAAILGALASSKQYMVFLAPVALMVRSLRVPFSLSAIGLTMATLSPYLLADPQAVVRALYGNLAGIGNRPDSFSISGMLQTLGVTAGSFPRLPWIAMTLAFGLLIARRVRDLSDFVLGAALVLGFAFLTGVAFVNYWLLCGGLVLVGSIMKASSRPV